MKRFLFLLFIAAAANAGDPRFTHGTLIDGTLAGHTTQTGTFQNLTTDGVTGNVPKAIITGSTMVLESGGISFPFTTGSNFNTINNGSLTGSNTISGSLNGDAQWNGLITGGTYMGLILNSTAQGLSATGTTGNVPAAFPTAQGLDLYVNGNHYTLGTTGGSVAASGTADFRSYAGADGPGSPFDMTIKDATGQTVVFHFSDNGVPIFGWDGINNRFNVLAFDGSNSASQKGTAYYLGQAINGFASYTGSNFYVTASSPGYVPGTGLPTQAYMHLDQQIPGIAGNNPITLSSTANHVVVTGFGGGTQNVNLVPTVQLSSTNNIDFMQFLSGTDIVASIEHTGNLNIGEALTFTGSGASIINSADSFDLFQPPGKFINMGNASTDGDHFKIGTLTVNQRFAHVVTNSIPGLSETFTSGSIALSGTLHVPGGGTGATSLTGLVLGNGTNTMTALAIGANLAQSGTNLNVTASDVDKAVQFNNGGFLAGSGSTFAFYKANPTLAIGDDTSLVTVKGTNAILQVKTLNGNNGGYFESSILGGCPLISVSKDGTPSLFLGQSDYTDFPLLSGSRGLRTTGTAGSPMIRMQDYNADDTLMELKSGTNGDFVKVLPGATGIEFHNNSMSATLNASGSNFYTLGNLAVGSTDTTLAMFLAGELLVDTSTNLTDSVMRHVITQSTDANTGSEMLVIQAISHSTDMHDFGGSYEIRGGSGDSGSGNVYIDNFTNFYVGSQSDDGSGYPIQLQGYTSVDGAVESQALKVGDGTYFRIIISDTVTLSSGSATVVNSAVLSGQGLQVTGSGTPVAALAIKVLASGTFQIISSSGSDSRTVNWFYAPNL